MKQRFLTYLPLHFSERDEPGFSTSMVGVADGLLQLVAAGLLSRLSRTNACQTRNSINESVFPRWITDPAFASFPTELCARFRAVSQP